MRKRLTFANVISVIALFVALGGVGYAAVRLPKNSVGTRQLKANAVTGAKVRNGSLTGDDLAAGTLGTVPLATSATDATHAAGATHASDADTATTAGTATNAGHADNADRLGGAPRGAFLETSAVKRIVATITYGAAPQTVLQAGPLTLTASCHEGGIPETVFGLEAASSATAPSIARSAIVTKSGGSTSGAESFPISQTPQPLFAVGGQAEAIGTIVYTDSLATITIDYRVSIPGSSQDCAFSGTAVVAS